MSRGFPSMTALLGLLERCSDIRWAESEGGWAWEFSGRS
jgi:hypothetical protein